jgi:hypothetical protein
MDARHNILLDLTGANTDKMSKRLKEFVDRGYEPHLISIAYPAWKATGRVWDRFVKNAYGHRDPNDEPGRFVPPTYARDIVDGKPETTYATLKEHPAVRSYVQLSTDVPKGEPAKVIDRGER